jgi:hypothetical protein
VSGSGRRAVAARVGRLHAEHTEDALRVHDFGADEPPEPQTDEALADVGRVILRMEVTQAGATYL